MRKGSESPVRPGATGTKACRRWVFSQQPHKGSPFITAAGTTYAATGPSGARPASTIFSISDAAAADIAVIRQTGAATAVADTFASHQSPATTARHSGQ